jgi:long-subunit acyl-CoA synthetase (AMP-forming)
MPAWASLCEVFQATAGRDGDRVALRTPGGAEQITWAQYARHVERVAAGLAGLGVGRGDTVALMLTNRPEFHLVDTGAMHLGAVPFSVYNTSSVEQVTYLFANAGNRVTVCERAFLDTVRAAGAETVVLVDGEAPGTIALAELEAMGEPNFDFEAAWRAVGPEDVVTLIYTSGTTGPPKGVELTHRSVMAECRGCDAVIPQPFGGRATSFLPSAHIADRWANHYWGGMWCGATVTCIADIRTVASHLPEVRPTAWGAVPRVWEKIKAAIEASGVVAPATLPEAAKAAIREKIGLDRAAWLVSGAAPASVEVLEFFADLGLPICELWGMSELSCCATINPPHDNRLGTCGPPLPGVELRLAEDGELLARGDLVMRGYRGEPGKTAEAIDADGWLHTGDVARFDADGYVTIVDRKKELIINSAGKNMSPANIEARLKTASPLIGQAVCIGDRRPFNVALLVLDPDGAAAWARAYDIAATTTRALAGDPRVRAEVERAVTEANAALSRVEQIKRFTLLGEDWLPGGDELTPTMKLRRRPIAAKYAEEIEALYAPFGVLQTS